MTKTLTLEGKTFIARARFEDREFLKRSGFDWDPGRKAWTTQNPQVAGHLRQYADSDAKTKIERSLISVRPWVSCMQMWPAHLTPKTFQTLAARWVLERNYSYVAADPGLGKTIIAALVINALNLRTDEKTPVVISSPPGLCFNAYEEIKKWALRAPLVAIYDRDYPYQCDHTVTTPDILILPDTLLADPLGAHERLRVLLKRMNSTGDAVLFVDEAQRFNNLESKRTQALFKIADAFEKVCFLSGTPMRNRPLDLYAILSKFAGETIGFKNEHQFGFRYCAGYFDSYGKPNYDGASNVTELFTAIKKNFMYRIEKKDVLKSLPPKTEEIVFLSDGETPVEITHYERVHLRRLSPTDALRRKLTLSPALSTYRRLLGRHKAKAAAEFIAETLDGGDENLLVFAEHIETVETLLELLKRYKPIGITGKVPMELRQRIVRQFQTGPHRLFIGNTQACGTGFTLTKATRVIHVEPSWVPADSDQASDRAHRIGQTGHVFVQYLCFRNSLDRAVIETVMKKRETLREL